MRHAALFRHEDPGFNPDPPAAPLKIQHIFHGEYALLIFYKFGG